MQATTVEPYHIEHHQSVFTGESYMFSPGFFVEFGQVQSAVSAESRSSGMGQFRIDYTRIGRYECEFLDHTFGYRGEKEITLLATPRSPEWAVITSIPGGVYHGCAVVVLLDALAAEDRALFEKLEIDPRGVIQALDVDQRWLKFTGASQMIELFEAIYRAHAESNKELVFLKALELLVYVARCGKGAPGRRESNNFFPAGQVNAVKDAHAFLLSHYTQAISFEGLVASLGVSYSLFNTIFKVVYGEPPYQYLKKLRVNRAAEMLLKTDLSILEIAGRVGYSNPSKFSSAFRSVMGVLPRAFRQDKTGMEHFML